MAKNVDIKNLELAIAKLNKEFGKNSVIYGSNEYENVPAISTNNIKLDLALGIGGLPKGRIIEIFGGSALGKSLLALNCIKSVQQQGGKVLYVDAEHDLDPDWMTTLGVDLDNLLIAQPEYGEQGLQIALDLIATGELDLVVIDSVAALVPKAELDGSIEDNHIGLQARMLAQALRKMRHVVSDTGTCLLFINQIRDKIGFMQSGTTSPGGHALKFYSSVRIELKRMGDIKNNQQEVVGTRVKAIVLKSKVSRPMKSTEYDILHGKGFNNTGALIELAEQFGMIRKSGAYYYLKDAEKAFAQGSVAAAEYLDNNPEYYQSLQEEVIKAYRSAK